MSKVLIVLFDASTIFLLRNQQRQYSEYGVVSGILLFVFAQVVAIVQPYLRGLSVPILFSNASVLLISLSLVRQQVVNPLVGRASQLESVRDIGLIITSRLRLDAVLSSIAGQATVLLNADSAGIYRLLEGGLVLSAVYNMPRQFIGHKLSLGEGVAGKVALDGQTVCLDDYALVWQGTPDLPLAHSTFGSVVVSPLVFSDKIQGILLVVQARRGKVFSEEDVRLLELLGPQAAVAIANSELFEQQSALTDQLEAAKNQLETVLISTRSPVVAVDRRLRIIFANPAAENLIAAICEKPVLRKEISEFINRNCMLTDLVPTRVLPESLREFLQAIWKRQAYIYDLDLVERSYMCHVAPLGQPRAVGWVAILNDVTELKELDRFKSQMVRMTSHDLKNPLFAAMSYLELLHDEFEDNSQMAQLNTTYVDIIMQQLDRMNRTVSSILDLERVQAGIYTRDLCRLPLLIKRVVDDTICQVDRNQLLLEVNIDPDLPPVLGDQRQLGQLIANLVENAIKFTPNGGGILVEALPAEDDGVLFSVKDTGVGIPVELHSRVFERFFRGQQPGVEHVSGSGLGLSLVRAIVSAHQGRVWLDSAPGQGTTVYVWLPQYQEASSS